MTTIEHCFQPRCLLGTAFRCQKCHHQFCVTHNPQSRHDCRPELRWMWSETHEPATGRDLTLRVGDREYVGSR